MIFAFMFFMLSMNYVKADTGDRIIPSYTRINSLIEKSSGNGVWEFMNVNKFEAGEDYVYQIGCDTKNGSNIVVKNRQYNNKFLQVIKSGYKEKSNSEIGVLCDDDAYVATQIAINYVYNKYPISDFDKYYRAKEGLFGSDRERADNIIKAAKSMLLSNMDCSDGFIMGQVGNYGVEYTNPSYYSQDYEMKIKNRKVNYYNLRGSSKDKLDFVFMMGDEDVNKITFKTMIPKDKAEMSFDLRISADVNYNVKRVFLGFDGKDYYIIYSTVTENTSISSTIDNRRSSLAIKFIDEETKELVSDCVVAVNGTSYNIDNTGSKILNKVGKEVIKAKILSVNNDYYVPDSWNNEVDINIKFREDHVEYIQIPHKAGSLKVETNLNDVEYGIYDLDNNLVKECLTDSNGNFYIESLNTGNYILKQISCKDGYKFVDDIEFIVKHNNECFLEFMNEEIPKSDVDNDENEDKDNSSNIEDNVDKEQDDKEDIKDDDKVDEPSSDTDDNDLKDNVEHDNDDNKQDGSAYDNEEDNSNKSNSNAEDKKNEYEGELDDINTGNSDNVNDDIKLNVQFDNYGGMGRVDRILPRTGNDYFIERLIFSDLCAFVIFICVFNYNRLRLKY